MKVIRATETWTKAWTGVSQKGIDWQYIRNGKYTFWTASYDCFGIWRVLQYIGFEVAVSVRYGTVPHSLSLKSIFSTNSKSRNGFFFHPAKLVVVSRRHIQICRVLLEQNKVQSKFQPFNSIQPYLVWNTLFYCSYLIRWFYFWLKSREQHTLNCQPNRIQRFCRSIWFIRCFITEIMSCYGFGSIPG